MHLSDPALRQLRGLARVQERVRAALDLRLDLQRLEQGVDDALRLGVAALDDAGDTPVLVRQLLARGQVHARDLEERDALVADGAVSLGDGEEARQQRRAQDGLVARERQRKPQRVAVGILGHETRGVRLGEAAADEHVFDGAPQLLLAREAPDRVSARRQRERDIVEDEARNLLDEVGLARHVTRAPRRHGDGVAVDLEPEPAEDAALLVGGNVETDELARARRTQLDHRARRQLAVRVGLRPPSARRSSRR